VKIDVHVYSGLCSFGQQSVRPHLVCMSALLIKLRRGRLSARRLVEDAVASQTEVHTRRDGMSDEASGYDSTRLRFMDENKLESVFGGEGRAICKRSSYALLYHINYW
jgi:hypothetical protein